MSFLSVSRCVSSSVRVKTPNFALATALPLTTSSSSAENYWTHLQKDRSNIEKALNAVKDQLDTRCVNEVLQRCAVDKPQLGLRFFIWAGLRPGYRHSSYMYQKACELFEIGRNPRVVNDVIEAYKAEGFSFSVKMFKVVINLCKEAKLAEEGSWVLRKMSEVNCRPDTTAYNVVIKLFCVKGNMNEAAKLMKEMRSIGLYPDMITYISMVKGFCDVGRIEDARELFEKMRKDKCPPNSVAYSALLDGMCRFGNFERALELLQEMEKEGGDCKPNVVSYTSVIQSFCLKGKLSEALNILDHMEAFGCAPNRTTVTTLITGLCSEGRVEAAYGLVDRVVERGSLSAGECFSSLVLSLMRIKRQEEAEKLFKKMLASSVKPDGLASSLLIKALCSEGRVSDGFHFYDEMERLGCLPSMDSDVFSILLSGLCQDGNLEQASKLARRMIDRKIPFKAPFSNNVIEYLQDAGEKDLVSHITGRCKC